MTDNPAHSQRQFTNTRWSTVTRAGALHTTDARAALVELCLRYWYPVYAHVRRCGHAPPIAQDITRSFLQHLFGHFAEDAAARTQARFRLYLLARLNTFLADDWRRSIDDEVMAELAPAPTDLEPRNRRDNAQARSPVEAYQRSFALELLLRAFRRLRREARQSGHVDMYEALERFLAIEPAAGQYEELARNLGLRPLTLVVALKRLRQRLRELIGEELADTVSSIGELEAEQQALHAILRECSP